VWWLEAASASAPEIMETLFGNEEKNILSTKNTKDHEGEEFEI
jgi:hypothetical protein